MSELEKLLQHRRKLDHAGTEEYTSEHFREASTRSPPKETALVSKEREKASQSVAAFRSGWTNSPKLAEWQKPDAGSSAAPIKKPEEPKAKFYFPDVSEEKVATQPVQAKQPKTDSKDTTLTKAKRSEVLQVHQKQRLDNLFEFANAESDRLNRLITEAHGDYDSQSDQLKKLMSSKVKTDKILEETRKQRGNLETSLKKAEAERDEAQAATNELLKERQTLQGMISSAKDENTRLENVVASVTAEKKQLEVIASQKSYLEKQLAEAQAMSAQLSEKAKRAERLDKLIETGATEKARLERLLTESSDERGVIQRQKEALDQKVAEVTKHNAQLQEQLKVREQVEQAVGLLKAKNVKLEERFQASETEKQRLEQVLQESSTQNHRLQGDLQEAAHKYSELEKRAAALEKEREELSVRPQVKEVEERIEAVKREAQEAHEHVTQEMHRHSEKCKERVLAIEKEKEAMQQEIEELRKGAGASEDRAVALSKDVEVMHQKLEAAQQKSVESEARAAAMERERDELKQRLLALGAPIEDLDMQGATQDAAVSSTVSDEVLKASTDGKAEQHQGHQQQIHEIEQAHAAEVEYRTQIAQQLEEALQHNEELQRRIDQELVPKKPQKDVAPETKAVDASPSKETDFSKILDSWLSALDDAHAEPAGRGKTSSYQEAKPDPGFASWVGSLFGGT